MARQTRGAGDEGHARRDKPAADDAQHARDAEDGALAAFQARSAKLVPMATMKVT